VTVTVPGPSGAQAHDRPDERPPLAALARLSRRPPPAKVEERCELCGLDVPDEHPHIVDIESRALLCACRPCGLLFPPEAALGRFRGVPSRWAEVPVLDLSTEQWDRLQIPVEVAFFFVNSALDRVAAFYPGPAGATESLLDLESWGEVTDANPSLAGMMPDVEAFLVRSNRSRREGFIVPIDACYELVGHLRQLWRGFDGGSDAHRALDGFFERVQANAAKAAAPAAGPYGAVPS
jgi:hypothetical protein